MGGSTIRRNCHWIPPAKAALVSDETGGKFTNYDHPDLLRALRGLDDYDKWVSLRLIPIVCKWIDENREAVIKELSGEQMDDIGAAVEATYKIIEKSKCMEERLKEADKLDRDAISYNPIWRRQTIIHSWVLKNLLKKRIKPNHAFNSDWQKTLPHFCQPVKAVVRSSI